jgi:hypothetical protein
MPEAKTVLAPRLHALAYTLASTETLEASGSPGTYAELRARASGAKLQIVAKPHAAG